MIEAPPLARLRHRLPGRTRVRLDPPVAGAGRLGQLADRLAALPGVQAVDINPATGSILFRHEHAYDPLIAAGEARLLEMLAPSRPEPFDAGRAVARRIEDIDALVQRASGGRVDSAQVTIAGLVLLGLVQMGRGQIAGPALTLFGQAAALAMARPLRKFAR